MHIWQKNWNRNTAEKRKTEIDGLFAKMYVFFGTFTAAFAGVPLKAFAPTVFAVSFMVFIMMFF